VLQSIGSKKFSRAAEPQIEDGSDADSVQSNAPEVRPSRQATVTVTASNSQEIQKSGAEGEVVVSQEVSELVCKEALRQLSLSLTTLLKRRSDIALTFTGSTKRSGRNDSTFGMFQSLAQYAGSIATALFALFEQASQVEEVHTTSAQSKGDTPKRKKKANNAKSPTSLQGEEASLIVDTLSNDRIGQLLEVLTKLLVTCNKEYAAITKAAEHTRKVGALVEQVLQQDDQDDDSAGRRSPRPQSRASAFIGDSSDDDSVFGETAIGTDSLRTEEQLARLSKVTTDVTCTVLFGTLASVPCTQILNLRQWLERRICNAPMQPRGDALALMKRVKATLTELDTHRGALGKLLEVIDRRPRQVKLCTLWYVVPVVHD
jgi:hypothetical protein